MAKITVYFQDALQKELDDECRDQGLVDDKGRIIRAPIIQKATRYYLTNFKGRKIVQPRVKLRKLVANLIIPQLNKDDIKAWRIQKPHSPEAYKNFIQKTNNPPEVKEALCLEVEKAFKETRDASIEILLPEEEPEVKDKAWYLREMQKTETYKEVHQRLEEIKENERKQRRKQSELQRQKIRDELEERRRKWQRQVEKYPFRGLFKRYIDYIQKKADESNISFLEARKAVLGEHDTSIGSVKRWQETQEFNESVMKSLARKSKQVKAKHRRNRK